MFSLPFVVVAFIFCAGFLAGTRVFVFLENFSERAFSATKMKRPKTKFETLFDNVDSLKSELESSKDTSLKILDRLESIEAELKEARKIPLPTERW